MVFGDVGSTKRWKAEGGRVEVHGPGLQQGRDRTRRGGPVGAIHRRDRRIDFEQRRPFVRERLGRVGHQACRRDRRSSREEAVGGCAASRGRCRGDAGAVCGSRNRQAHFRDDRQRHGHRRRRWRRWQTARATSPPRCAARIASRRRTAAPMCCRPSSAVTRTIRSPIASSCFPFASVVAGAGGGSARMPRAVAGRHLHLERSGVPRALRRLSARRSPELRAAVDDADWVGSAARRESVRASVCAPRDPAAGVGDPRRAHDGLGLPADLCGDREGIAITKLRREQLQDSGPA